MKSLKIFIVLLFSLLLSGCWDAVELEEQAYVVAIGMDEGEDNQLEITFQIGNPQVGSSDRANADREPASEIITLVAPDKISARDLANVSVSRKLTFSHAKMSVKLSLDHFLANFFLILFLLFPEHFLPNFMCLNAIFNFIGNIHQ